MQGEREREQKRASVRYLRRGWTAACRRLVRRLPPVRNPSVLARLVAVVAVVGASDDGCRHGTDCCRRPLAD